MNNKINSKKIYIVTISIFVLMLISLMGVASAKSLYVISDIGTSPTPIQSYDVQGSPTYLAYQTTSTVPYYQGGAVGVAIDTDSEFLFITYEGWGSSRIQLVDATTMSDEGYITAPNAYNLAGIVVDQDNQKVYAVDRDTNHLYIYSWDATTKTLTNDVTTSPYYISLSGVSKANGLALDEVNDLLYVGDMVSSNNVRVFSTSDWSQTASYTVSQHVQGIAVDVTNGIIYTGNAGWYSTKNLLIKYDIATNTETNVDIRTLTTSVNDDSVVGLAVDPETSLLYITTGNQGSEGRQYDDTDMIMVLDSNLNVLKTTGDIGDPTGLVIPGKDISYNPLNLDKDDGVSGCVGVGDTMTYTISYSNGNPTSVTGVTITDALPTEVDYTGPTTWSIGTLTPGQSGSVTLAVTVNSNAVLGGQIDNSATISANEAGTGPTTQHEITDVCSNRPPTADAGSDQTVEQESHQGTEVTLDGSGSSDPDNDALTYEWTWTGGSATGVNPMVVFPLGTTIVTLTVDDGQLSDIDTVDIIVEDTTIPEITPSDDLIELWSPNHKYHTVGISDCVLSVTDICDGSLDIDDVVITSVSSDEPENVKGKGDGNTVDDIVIVDSQTIDLRAERQGNGNGRVYTINYEVTDASSNTATGSCKVSVRHDQKPGNTAIDDGASAGYIV